MSIVKDPTGIPLNYFAPADATALASEIKSGQTAYIGGGKVTGTAYTPAMMKYDGATGYYNASATTSGNKWTVAIRFKGSPNAGSSSAYLFSILGPSTRIICNVEIGDASHADADFQNRLRVAVQNSAGANICRLYTNVDVADDTAHMLFAAFDGDAGTAQLVLDGVSVINASAANHNAPTTGTLDAGASSTVGVGADYSGLLGSAFQIGYVGYRHGAYLTNPTDFMDSNGNPKSLDESGWTEWGAQPLFWNPHGYMQDNRGSAGAMTANGTIIVGDGGST